ncbi:8261_t:CDS:2, partial [Acaulospora morrowiae]
VGCCRRPIEVSDDPVNNSIIPNNNISGDISYLSSISLSYEQNQSQDCDRREDINYNKQSTVAALLNPCQSVLGMECICRRPTEIHETSNHSMDNYNTLNDNISDNFSSYLPPMPPFYEQNRSLNHDQEGDINGSKHSTVLPSWKGLLGNEASLMASINSNSEGFTSLVHNENVILNNSSNGLEDISRDQSKVLGEQLCNASSDDLAKIIYHPFQSCSSAAKNGSCCGASASLCSCSTECSCDGCNSQKRVTTQVAITPLSVKNCCSLPRNPEVTLPERTTIFDEDGVVLCGCGCKKTDTECIDCLGSLCE